MMESTPVNAKKGRRQWAIVLVHGVGDTEPGQMIKAVVEPMTAVNAELVFEANPEYYHLSENAPDGGRVQYPVHMRRGKADKESVLLAEVHWADLARIRHGTDELIYELFRLIYGIRHIVVHAATQPGNCAFILGMLFRMVFFLLQGPIFALLLFQAGLSCAYLFFFQTIGTNRGMCLTRRGH